MNMQYVKSNNLRLRFDSHSMVAFFSLEIDLISAKSLHLVSFAEPYAYNVGKGEVLSDPLLLSPVFIVCSI